MNEKKACQAIARAICELDRASRLLQNVPHKRNLEISRLRLWKLLRKLGYEFARYDSAVIKKIKL